MPNATGYLTAREVAQIRRFAADGMKTADIAAIIGRCELTVLRYSGSLVERTRRAARYDRLVQSVSAYVPTFWGGQ